MTHSEAPLSVNFKPAAGFEAPMLTVRASDPVELTGYVGSLDQSGLFTAITDADAKFKAAYAPSAGAQVATQVLGAQTQAVEAAPVAAAAPAAGGWGAAAPAAQWGAPAAQAAPAAAAPVAAAPAAPAAASPGAPFIPAFGMAAVFRSGQGARGPWSAYFDPRPKAQTDMIPAGPDGKVPSTDDPNHPGLAAGTHKFSKFIR